MTKEGTATNRSLGDLYNGMRGGSIKLNPDFQRKLVWNDRHKEAFIDTILKKYPFPEVYFCNGDTDLKLKKTIKLVVDGQQRLSTIYSYIEGKLSNLKNITSYEELTDDEKKDFLEYPVVVRDLGKANDKDIKEIFRRINSVNYALNATEIRHALYDGEFISVAQKISKIFPSELPIFGDNQINRMKDIELFLQIMVSIEMGGYLSSNDGVEDLTKEYNNQYKNKKIMYQNLMDVILLLKSLNLDEESIWFKRSNFFTLTVELINYKLKNKTFPKKEKLKTELIAFNDLIESNKNKEIEKNKYAQYYYYTYQGTNSKNGRIIRGGLLREHIEKI